MRATARMRTKLPWITGPAESLLTRTLIGVYSMRMKARDVIKALEADGWTEVRSKGSHRQFQHPVKPGTVTVAFHGSEDLRPKTLRSIEHAAGINLRGRT